MYSNGSTNLNLIKQNQRDFSREVDGISNSLSSLKCLWNEDRPLTFTSNSNLSVRITSNNVNYHQSGTGVKLIRITGLFYSLVDGVHTYSNKFEDVVINGTAEMTPTNPLFYRVLKLECLEFGSLNGMQNQGDIKVYPSGSPTSILNCMKAGDNISNSLIIGCETGKVLILEKININSYFHTATELICKVIRNDGSEMKFQKFYLNSNTSFIQCPIKKRLESGETFYCTLNPLEPIIGNNNLCVLLETVEMKNDKVRLQFKPITRLGQPSSTAPVYTNPT